MVTTRGFGRCAGVFGCVMGLVFSAPAAAAEGGFCAPEGAAPTGSPQILDVAGDRCSESNDLLAGLASVAVALDQDVTPQADLVADVDQHGPADSDRVLRAICRDETVYHTILKGNTLFSIARRYGIELDDLLRLNGLRKRSRLSVGQKIIVRRSGPRSHVVRRGETLQRIATRYGIKTAGLVRLNHLDGKKIKVGQRLLIEPCDPYAAAGSAPPPLGDQGTAAPEVRELATAITESAATSASFPESDAASTSASAIAQRVIKLARTMLDIPYRFGGTTLRGIDCSAYVQRVFELVDVRIPRTAREQYGVGTRIVGDGLAVGDLVFFRTYASFPSHVGIYLGDNLFIHASSMVDKVTIDSMDRPYYRKRYIGARRLLVDESSALANR